MKLASCIQPCNEVSVLLWSAYKLIWQLLAFQCMKADAVQGEYASYDLEQA